MEQEKKDGNYSLNTFKDIWKYDRARLLDLGNVFQVGLSQNKPEVDEEARALSNFEKLTEDVPRPVKHTLVDATRLLPDIIAIALAPAIKGVGKVIGKGVTNGATKGVAKKLVSEGTSDAFKALSKSKFLPRDDKVLAGKKWVRDLLENKNAMERVAGRELKDKEVEAIRKNINKFVPHKIDKYNADVDKLKDIYKRLNIKEKFETREDLVKYLSTNKKSLGLTDTEYKNLVKNIDSLSDYNVKISHSHLPVDRVIEKEKLVSTDGIKDILTPGRKHLALMGTDAILKGGEASVNELGKTIFETDKKLEMKPDYWTLGSEPTPISDLLASIFNVDFDDPSRFNKKDIEVFFEFLEDVGTIEPGIKDKWTPRQKVSVMREMLSDKVYGPFIKERWKKSKHNKDLTKYYSGE